MIKNLLTELCALLYALFRALSKWIWGVIRAAFRMLGILFIISLVLIAIGVLILAIMHLLVY